MLTANTCRCTPAPLELGQPNHCQLCGRDLRPAGDAELRAARAHEGYAVLAAAVSRQRALEPKGLSGDAAQDRQQTLVQA